MSDSGAYSFAYRGSAYRLGYGPGFFGIWAHGGEEPMRRFPRTDEGWADAWTEFRTLEPSPEPIPHGEPGLAPGETMATLATPARRLGARVVDGLVLATGLLAALALTGNYPAGGLGSTRAIPDLGWLLVASLVYEVSFIATRGQTLGKMALRIRVAALPDGGDPGWARAFLRWLVPVFMNIVPGLGLLAWAWVLVDPLRQGLHDKAAGTVVVSVEGMQAGPPP